MSPAYNTNYALIGYTHKDVEYLKQAFPECDMIEDISMHSFRIINPTKGLNEAVHEDFVFDLSKDKVLILDNGEEVYCENNDARRVLIVQMIYFLSGDLFADIDYADFQYMTQGKCEFYYFETDSKDFVEEVTFFLNKHFPEEGGLENLLLQTVRSNDSEISLYEIQIIIEYVYEKYPDINFGVSAANGVNDGDRTTFSIYVPI